MAIDTPTVLTQGSSGTDASSYATASVTPTANALLLLCVVTGVSSGTNADPTSVTGNGLTWVKVDGGNTGNGTANTTVWRAMGASPSAGAVTINLGATISNAAWQLVQVTNVDTSGTNGSGAVVQHDMVAIANSTPSVTLSNAIGSGNGTIGWIGYNAGTAQAITAGAGYALLGALQSSTSPTIQGRAEYLIAGSTTVNYSTGNSSAKVVVAVEVADASATTQTGDASLTATATPSADSAATRVGSVSTTATAAPTAAATVRSAATNLITNPSFETGTTGWSQSQGTGFATSTTHGGATNGGAQAAKVTLDASAHAAQVDWSTQLTVSPSTDYTAWVSGWLPTSAGGTAVSIGLLLTWLTSGGAFVSSQNITVFNPTRDSWARAVSTITSPSTAGKLNLSLSVSSNTATGDVWLDAVGFAQTSVDTGHFDGDTPDTTDYIYAWTGTANASTSTRTPAQLQTIALAGSGTAATGSAGSISVPYPTGVTATDALVMYVGVGGNAITTPSGWTQMGIQTGSFTSVGLYLKTADGTESGSVAVSTASGASEGRIFRYTGVDATTSQDTASVSSTGSNAGGALTFDVSALTTVTPGAVDIVAVRGRAFGDVTTSTPGYAEEDNTSASAYYDHTQTAAGSTGTVSVTVPTNPVSNSASAVHAVLRPGSATGTTQTGSASQTGTGTASAAGSLTRGGAASQTATAAPTADGTVTRPGSATATATAAPTAAGAITKLGSASTTATASPTAAGDLTRVGSASTAATAAPTAAGSLIRGGAASQTATGTASAAGTATHVGIASTTASAAPTADGVVTRPGSASLTATASPSAAGNSTRPGDASTTATGTASASATATHAGSTAATASAGTTADGTVTRPGSASLTVTAVPTADGLASGAGRADTTVTASPTASGNASYAAAASQTATATRTADGFAARPADSNLTATAGATADGPVGRFADASLAASAAPSADGTVTRGADASLTVTGSRPADGHPTRFGDATTVTGVANPTADGTAASPSQGSAQLDVFAAPTGDGTVTHPSDAALVAAGTATAAGSGTRPGDVSQTATAVLAAAGEVIRAAQAQLTAEAEPEADGSVAAVSDVQLVTVGAIPLV